MKIELKEINKKTEEAVEVDEGIYYAKNCMGEDRILIAKANSARATVLYAKSGFITSVTKVHAPAVYNNIKKIKNLRIEYEV